MPIRPFTVFAAAALLSAAAHGPAVGQSKSPQPVVPEGAVAAPTSGLAWESTSGASRYQVEVFDRKNTRIVTKKVTPDEAKCASRPICSIPAPAALPTGPVRWRVRADRAGKWGPWSGWASFWVGGPVIFESTTVNKAVVGGPQTITSIEVDLPGPGAAHVTSSGLLNCRRLNTDGLVDVTSVVTDDPADDATGARAGFIVLWQTMSANQRVSMPQATGRVFAVAAGGKRAFYWRSNGYTLNAVDDQCTIYAAVLTVTFVPWLGEPVEPPATAVAPSASAPAGSALAD